MTLLTALVICVFGVVVASGSDMVMTMVSLVFVDKIVRNEKGEKKKVGRVSIQREKRRCFNI